MSLRDWQRNSWLVQHKTSPEEISGLLAIVERDLGNAQVAGLAGAQGGSARSIPQEEERPRLRIRRGGLRARGAGDA